MDQLKRWINRTGTFSIGDISYGPGEKFTAFDSQVPMIFRDTIDCLGIVGEVKVEEVRRTNPISQHKEIDGSMEVPAFTRRPSSKKIQLQVPPVGISEPKETKSSIYQVEERDGASGWFNVINTSDKTVVNFNAMRKGKAEELAEEMNNGDTE